MGKMATDGINQLKAIVSKPANFSITLLLIKGKKTKQLLFELLQLKYLVGNLTDQLCNASYNQYNHFHSNNTLNAV